MRAIQFSCLILLNLLFATSALAIEASTAVRVTPILKSTTSWDGTPIVYPQGQAEITGMIVEMSPGAETGWHLHPVSSFGMIIEGEMEVTLKTGEVKHMKAGDSVVEVANILHNGRNTGSTPLKIIVFYAGEVGSKLTVKETESH
jgi:quercetin dioxygenase-like cupin family protein